MLWILPGWFWRGTTANCFLPLTGMFLLPNCLNSTPEVILPELLQFALHPIWRDRITIWSRQQEAFSLQGPPGSLPQEIKCDHQRRKGTCRQTQNFCPNVPMPIRILRAGSKFFWGFIRDYISVLCCIDSEQHSRAELQHIWNNCFGFDSIITLMRKVSCLY